MSIETQNKLSVANPLAKYFRQPAIYVNLPTGGKWWPEGSLDLPENGELPVYPMTVRDEVTLRTPDALLNGQGVVDVVQSCFPNIKNAWKMPASDVDAVLISMRIASNGHSMDFSNTCPHCKEEHVYGVDLRHLLASITVPDYDEPGMLGDNLEIKFRPQNYAELNKANQLQFEITRLNSAIQNMDESSEKMAQSAAQLEKYMALNQEIIAGATESIRELSSEEAITDRNFINEFYSSIDARMFNSIQELLVEKTKDSGLKVLPVNCQSCEEQIDLTILFDYANFFVVGS